MERIIIGGDTMQASKKVIILDNIPSRRISQAIFILADGAEDDIDAVREAERLVCDFLGGKPLRKRRISRRAGAVIFALAITVLCIAAAICFIF